MKQYLINTSGRLCDGELISIGWPERAEYNTITALRNKPQVKKWFLDNSVLDPIANQHWIETRMRRPEEALLSIRLKHSDTVLGIIGWSDWDIQKRTACFGRLAVDTAKICELAYQFSPNYVGVALDAAMTLRDFAFLRMNLHQMFTYYIVGNGYAERINKTLGLAETGRSLRIRPDGTKIITVEMALTRQQWESLTNNTNSIPSIKQYNAR